MRKIIVFITILCLSLGLALSVNAASQIDYMEAEARVSSDSSCRIILSLELQLDQPTDDLRYPLPANATEVVVNNDDAVIIEEGGLRYLDLSQEAYTVGKHKLKIRYTLPEVVAANKDGITKLTLPLLSGFPYPIADMTVYVTLPGEITEKPTFSSGYHQANIEKDLQYNMAASSITVSSLVPLKDHETLEMSLTVPAEMFPPPVIAPPDIETTNIIALVLFLAAVAYWLLFLRNMPVLAPAQPAPPDGYGVGELGSVLHLQGGDLNAMVFSWAQLGYLLIRVCPDGNVVLYRQMDMGNERSTFEQNCFRFLFGKKNIVNVSGCRYGAAYRAAKKLRPDLRALVRPGIGFLWFFRLLAAASGLFSGLSIAVNLSEQADNPWPWIILLGAAALASCSCMQLWARALVAPRRGKLWLAAALSVFWIGLSIPAGQLAAGIGMALTQFIAGWLLSLAGRRTPAGRQAIAETLGLRRYCKTVPKEELQQICRQNPEYFHQMVPYALALGVDKAFARNFGRIPVGQCPYIMLDTAPPTHARQWRSIIRQILRKMSTRSKPSVWKRFWDFVNNFGNA